MFYQIREHAIINVHHVTLLCKADTDYLLFMTGSEAGVPLTEDEFNKLFAYLKGYTESTNSFVTELPRGSVLTQKDAEQAVKNRLHFSKWTSDFSYFPEGSTARDSEPK